MSERYRRAGEIFLAACELAPKARAAFLDEACAGDESLRTQVLAMLAFEEKDSEFMERSPVRPPHKRDGETPDRIGSFRILRKLGEGGMGTVYEAEQASPHRRVALKVLRTRLLARDTVPRFQLEAKVLGNLSHPGIAQVYEAGSVVGERGEIHYFSMELVRGKTLSQHVRDEDLSIDQRLELMARVCDAVHHAHQQGVIHRDLKPANILVDESGQPKVLDFGVARAIDAEFQLETLLTDVGQIVGTLAYMSPEQAGGESKAIDTRSDIYALGVILYELLADALPYDLSSEMLHEAMRVIREDAPRKLSRVQPLCRGEVETIVGSAIEKDKDRRYASAASFAEDIRRFLRDQPILARRPSRIYLLRKFVKRNRTLVASAAVVILALGAGLIASLHFGLAEAAQRRLAEENSAEAVKQFDRASIFAAHQAHLLGNNAAARQRLDSIPPERRNWEWHHLDCELEWFLDQVEIDGVRHAVFLDEDRVLAVDEECRAYVWNTLSGEVERFDLPVEDEVDRRVPLCLSEDGRLLLSFASGRLYLGNALEDPRARSVPFDLGNPSIAWAGAAMTLDASRLVLVTEDQRAHVVDLGPDHRVRTVEMEPGWIHFAGISTEGDRLALGADHAMVLLDGETLEELGRMPIGRHILRSVDWSPTEQVAFVSGYEISPIDLDTGRALDDREAMQRRTPEIGVSLWLTTSPDGLTLATTHPGGGIRLLEAQSGEEIAQLHHPRGSSGLKLAFSPRGSRLLSYRGLRSRSGPETPNVSQALRLWRAPAEEGGRILRGHSRAVYPIAVDPDGDWIATGSLDRSLRLWDARTGDPMARIATRTEVRSLAFTHDGTKIAIGQRGGVLTTLDLLSGELTELDRLSRKPLRAVAAHPSRPEIAAVSHSSVRIWDLERGVKTSEVTATIGEVHEAAFDPSGSRLALGTMKSTVELWDVEDGRVLESFEGPRGGARDFTGALSVTWSPDGRRILSGWGDGSVIEHDASSLRERRRMSGHEFEVFSVAWSPDGTRIASGGRDGLLRVWDADSSENILALPGHESYVFSVAFDPSGDMIYTGSGDATARVWEGRPARERLRDRQWAAAHRAEITERIRDLFALHGSPESVLAAFAFEVGGRSDAEAVDRLRLARQAILIHQVGSLD